MALAETVHHKYQRALTLRNVLLKENGFKGKLIMVFKLTYHGMVGVMPLNHILLYAYLTIIIHFR